MQLPPDLDADLSALRAALDRLTSAGDVEGKISQSARIEAIRALEDVKDAACAAQAELAVAVVTAEVAVAEAVSDDADRDAASPSRAQDRRTARARRSAIAQVALARRESPHRGRVLVGMAEALVREMPHTLGALRSGAVNEFRATMLVRETACLDRAARAEVDEAVCGDRRSVASLGTRRLVAAAKREAYRLDPLAFVRRAERDTKERCVTLRPAPGSMTYLTALVPMAQGVAVLANLQRTADSVRATGDERSNGQVMADTLVERVTGQGTADAVPVVVNLVMSDASLLGSGHEPATLDGAHPVPAQLARELVARALAADDSPDDGSPEDGTPEDGTPDDDSPASGVDPGGTSCRGDHDVAAAVAPRGRTGARRREARQLGAWVRRLYADAGGILVAMDSRARTFPTALAGLLRVRDQGLCRTPYCDAPVRHLDHITPVAQGGPTSPTNGQGLCAGCNYTKQAPGWQQRVDTDAGRHTVITTTPTGHTHTATAPPLPAPLPTVSLPTVSLSTVSLSAESMSAESLSALRIELVPAAPGESPLEVAIAHAA